MKQKYLTFFLISLMLLLNFYCKDSSKNENTGEWNYRILINGNHAGKAAHKIFIDGNNYINELDMETSVGDIKNTSKRKLIETKDFKPVSLEIINKIINNNSVNEIKTLVKVKDDGVDVISDNDKYSIQIEKPFMFDGYYHTAVLKKIHFKKGDLIKSRIFDPQIDNESGVILNTAVSEIKTLTYREKDLELYHVLQYISNLKTIEMYMDKSGTVYRSRTAMLNYTMEMILE